MKICIRKNSNLGSIVVLLLMIFVNGCIDQKVSILPTNDHFSPDLTSTRPSPSPSNTPIVSTVVPSLAPTITFHEARDIIFKLLSHNGECELPCVWGFSPGNNDFSNLKIFVEQLGESKEAEGDYLSVIHSSSGGGINLLSMDNKIRNDITFSYSINDNKIAFISLLVRQDLRKGNAIDLEFEYLFGDDSFGHLYNYYQLPQILTMYGTPSDILISNWKYAEFNYPLPFTPHNLLIMYEDLGFLIEYVSPLRQDGEYLIGCPLNSHFEVVVWDPTTMPSLYEMVDHKEDFFGINQYTIENYMQLEEVTSYTLDSFVRVFSTPNETACIESPVAIWPAPIGYEED